MHELFHRLTERLSLRTHHRAAAAPSGTVCSDAARRLEWGVERLETRQLLAGTVTATLHGRTLDVRGDAQGNDVVVEQVGAMWQIRAGDSTTEILGTTEVTGARKIRVRLGDGDDRLVLNGLQVDGNIQIVGGAGDYDIHLSDVESGPLSVTDAGGSTTITLESSQISGRTKLTNKAGSLSMELVDTTLDGPVRTQVRGDDALRLDDASRVLGNVKRVVRQGSASTTIDGASRIEGWLRIAVDRGEFSDLHVSVDSFLERFIGPRPEVLRNEIYSIVDGEALRADVRIPASAGPHPAVLLIHGGYWRFGDKSTMSAQAEYLVSRGYTVVSINYRLAPESIFPAQVHDAKAAVRWMRDNAERLRIDPDRIAAYGYSAGAHLALMLGVTDPTSGLEGVSAGQQTTDSSVQAVIAGGAPTDFQDRAPNSTELAYFLGGTPAEVPEVYRIASPIHWVSPGDAPTLFYIGALDTVVDRDNVERMEQEMRELGIETELHVLSFATHLSAAADPRALARIAEFLEEQLG